MWLTDADLDTIALAWGFGDGKLLILGALRFDRALTTGELMSATGIESKPSLVKRAKALMRLGFVEREYARTRAGTALWKLRPRDDWPTPPDPEGREYDDDERYAEPTRG